MRELSLGKKKMWEQQTRVIQDQVTDNAINLKIVNIERIEDDN